MRRFVLLLAGVALALASFPGAAVAAPPVDLECSGTYTGGTYDAVTVPDGATCILEGVEAKSIRVGAGATLWTDETSVKLNVFSRRASSVRLIDTTVGGEVNIHRTNGDIVIGPDGCRVDPVVDGNINLQNNTGTIAVCFMTVRNLIVQNNHGRIGLFDNVTSNNLIIGQNTGAAIRAARNDVGRNILVKNNDVSKIILIKDNTVEGNLNCVSNSPVPTHTGNTVGGQNLDQCAL